MTKPNKLKLNKQYIEPLFGFVVFTIPYHKMITLPEKGKLYGNK